MILAESPRRQRVTKLVNWGHWFALANIVIAIIIASIFVFSSPLPGSAIGTFYLFANWFGHIGFMTFFGFVIFILPLCYLATNPRIIKAAASIIAATGLALLAFDALLFNKTGFHISLHAADLLTSEANAQMTIESWQQWTFLLLLFLVWLGFQLVLANAIWKRVDRFSRYHVGTKVSSFFVVSFVASHAIHVWADAKLYQPVIKQDNMFPLSYPATAKTTMSRYGLLDLAAYEERKQLQFNPEIHNINYPSEPVYCAIDSSKNMLVLVQTDTKPISELASYPFNSVANYYTTATSVEGLITSTLFGVPELYQESLENKRPVMLALPMGSGMPVSIFTPNITTMVSLNGYTKNQLQASDGLHIAFIEGDDVTSAVNKALEAGSDVIVATQRENRTGTVMSTLPLNAPMATTEDLAPTIMHALGCNAPITFYSTGQNLLAPKRAWLVSTSGERIVMFHNNERTDVLSNGSYEITDTRTGKRSNAPLNVNLLSQAIMHLTRFSENK
jgi:membrane-anchored protein YejM (alkaline phosphatase superfamily)